MKPLVRLLQADLDIEQARAYYAAEAPYMELSFLDALEKASLHIQRNPGMGSLRYAQRLTFLVCGFGLASAFLKWCFTSNATTRLRSFACCKAAVIFRLLCRT